MGILLDDADLCGATLLSLVAYGSALIAELLRLAQRIPKAFLDGSAKEFDEVLFDFKYLREPEECEISVNRRNGMLDVDAELLKKHGVFAQRFYALMQGIVNYWSDVQTILERLKNGYFITHTIDSILEDVDGKQLLCEAFFLYGTILLLLEKLVPGKARERLIIICYRLQGHSTVEGIDEVCLLSQSSNRCSSGYPENLFGRFSTEATQMTARLLMERLMSDDIYLQSLSFPSPEHRSIRLSSQASMLYVILYFDAETLRSHNVTMREIVDKYFSDNWVIPVYMGHVVDLSFEWASYYAAKLAVENVLTPVVMADLVRANGQLISRCISQLEAILMEGQLTESYLLEHLREILDCTRRCNSALRWRLLHRHLVDQHRCATFADNGCETRHADSTITLLLKSSQLEYKLKEMIQCLLKKKLDRWANLRTHIVNRMTELSQYFTGNEAFSRACRDEKMARWFTVLAIEAASLDVTTAHATILGRKIQTFITALEEVEHFERVDANLQIRACLAETRADLLKMIRLSAIAPDLIDIMDAIFDLSYAWGLLGTYMPYFHDRVRAEPSTAVLLRAMFLKLASILNIPLVRISQCNSTDARSVAAYYSGELVAFVRRVLDVIPVSVFGLLNDIVAIQTRALRPLQARIEAAYLTDYAQLIARYQLARLTHQAAAFTKSVLAMEKTLLGAIRVDPRCILHDGLRKELVCQLSRALDERIRFAKSRISENHGSFTQSHLARHIHATFDKVAADVDNYRQSVEYIQDYINIAGLKMWQEELARVVCYNVEHECNRYLRRQVREIESPYQSTVVPVPRLFEPAPTPTAVSHDGVLTFMGRIMATLLRLSTPQRTSYAPGSAGWYADGAVLGSTSVLLPTRPASLSSRIDTSDAFWPEVCGVRTFQAIEGAVGVVGLVGLDRMLAFRTVRELARYHAEHHRHIATEKFVDAICMIRAEPNAISLNDPTVCYARAVHVVESVMPEILHRVQAIGHCQLLRRSLVHALLARSRLNADSFSCSLKTIKTAALGDILDRYLCSGTTPTVDGSFVLARLSALEEATGLSNILTKVYRASENHDYLANSLLLFVLTYAHKLNYDKNVASLVKRKPTYPIDGFVIVVGVQTILSQCHPSYTQKLLEDLARFVCVTVQGGDTTEPVPLELLNIIWFIENLGLISSTPTPFRNIPAHILGVPF